MKAIATSLLLSVAVTIASAATVTLPISVLEEPDKLTAVSLSKRYLHRRAMSSAPLTSVYNDILYSVPLTLGTPPQPFNLAIDTGSPVTWVTSNTCIANACSTVTNQFNCPLSSTCRQTMTPFNSSYVSGTGVSGSYIVDTYNLGSMKFMGVAGLVTEDKVELPPTIDGILGLWYYPRIGDATILNVLKNSTALTQPIMGIWLQASTTVGVTSPGGEITIGGLNKDRYVGDITYVNCLPNRPWTIPMDEITVGSNVISTVGAMAAIDTGTTAMLVPQSYADLINGAIPGAVQALNLDNAWLLPCNGNVPITFTFGSFTAQVPYSTVAMQNRRYTSPQKPGVQLCKSSIMFPTGSVVSIEEWIIGATFLRTVYSVYDFGTNEASGGRIGFAFLSAGGGSKKPDSKDNANNNDGKNTGNNGTSGNKDDDADKPNSASRSLMSTTIAVQGAVLTVALLLALL